jgi:DNA ligase-1
MKQLMEIFDSIKNTSGKNDKQDIIRQHMGNVEFTRLLTFLYNPYIVTGIGKKKMNKFKTYQETKTSSFIDLWHLLDYIILQDGGISDAVLKAVANHINCQEQEIQEFLREVVTKEYKCGITSSTINKVYGKDFIPKHDIMLAEKWVEFEHKVTGDFIVTKKFDGIRCTAIKEDGEVIFLTRKGLPILGLQQLEQEFKFLPDNTVYDGELLNVNTEGLNSKELFRKTQQRVRKDGIKEEVEFNMYDMLPITEFRMGKSVLGASDRKESVYLLIDDHCTGRKVGFLRHIKDVPVIYFGSDKQQVKRLLDEAIAQGEEGVMVNVADGKYECKRTSLILKVKKFHPFDGLVVGVYEGEGKNKGKLGGVRITYKDLIVNVGSGFSDYERELYWNDPDEVIGKIGQCNYFEESENKKGEKDLRFCTWDCLRFDKGVEDVNYE